jgi:hypothetical protein
VSSRVLPGGYFKHGTKDGEFNKFSHFPTVFFAKRKREDIQKKKK